MKNNLKDIIQYIRNEDVEHLLYDNAEHLIRKWAVSRVPEKKGGIDEMNYFEYAKYNEDESYNKCREQTIKNLEAK